MVKVPVVISSPQKCNKLPPPSRRRAGSHKGRKLVLVGKLRPPSPPTPLGSHNHKGRSLVMFHRQRHPAVLRRCPLAPMAPSLSTRHAQTFWMWRLLRFPLPVLPLFLRLLPLSGLHGLKWSMARFPILLLVLV